MKDQELETKNDDNDQIDPDYERDLQFSQNANRVNPHIVMGGYNWDE